MDGQKEEDVSVYRGDLGESTVRVSEHVAEGREAPVESSGFEAKGQVGQFEGSNEGRGGEDIMVEVVGLNVFVDRVSGNNGGGVRVVGEEHMSDAEIRGGCGGSDEAGVGRDSRNLDGGNDVLGDSVAKEIGVSSCEVSSSTGLERGFGGPLVGDKMAEKSVERNTGAIVGESGGGSVDEILSHENGVQNDEVQNGGTGTRIEGSTTFVGSRGGETQVVHVDNVVVFTEGKDFERGLAKDDMESGAEMVNGAGSEEQDHGAENAAGTSIVTCTIPRGEIQVVDREAVKGSENAGEKEPDRSSQRGREINPGGEGAYQDVETQNLRILFDETQNPGNQTVVAASSTVLEYSTVVEEAAVLVREECLNPKVDASCSHPAVVIISSLEEKQVSIAEADDGGTLKDSIINAHSKSLDEKNPIAFSTEVAQMDKEECMCSTMEGMETDSFDENLSFSLEELQGNFGRVDESTENHCNVCADLPSFCQPTQVGRSEDAMDKKVHPENLQQLKLEGFLNEGTAHDVAHVDSSKEQPMEIDEQVSNAELDEMLACSGDFRNLKYEKPSMETDLVTEVTGREDEIPLTHNQEVLNSNVEVQKPAENDQPMIASNMGKGIVVEQEVNSIEQFNSYVGQEIEVQKQPKMVETTGGCVENYRTVCFDLTPTAKPTHEVVESEVMVVDDKAPSNLVVEVPPSQMHTCIIREGEIAPKESKEVLDSKVDDLVTAEVNESKAGDLSEVNSTTGQEMQVEEQVIAAEQVALHEGLEMEMEGNDSDTEQPEAHEEKFVKRTSLRIGNLLKSPQASYQLPLEDGGEFYVSDLVWGKVRSHPWWPGQIYDPSDASEKAMKYHKKDCFLVAYFGDRTFAWVDASQLKPFHSHFSQVEKQSNSEVFQNAVSCALQEVSRRLELGLACPCISKDAYDEIRLQIVENTGIRQELSVREGVDKSASANFFQPDKLVEYMKALAQSPSGGADRLELVIAQAQLLSFYRLKGYSQLPEFQFCGGLEENSVDASQFADRMHATPVSKDDEHIYAGQETSETQRRSYHKRKHNLKDSMYPRKKERSLSELMSGSFDSLDDDEFESDGKAGGKLASPSSGKKRKAVDFAGDDVSQDGRKTISLAKVSISTPNIPKPSFKIGECIRRVASQMTGSPSILKGNGERLHKVDGDGSDISLENSEDAEGKRMIRPTDYSSLDDLLSQLHLAARDPIKGYSFLNIIISFFSDFRNTIISDRSSADKAGGKRRKSSQPIVGSQETFEFEDMSDTYWTDRVIQNGAEEQASAPPPATNKRGYQIVPVELKPVQKSRRPYSKKQLSDGNLDLTPPKPPSYVDENSPAELIMNFSYVDTIPSETNLNKMFRRFGPLKESETEVDRETSRARVVFKKCSDAEVAHSSAAKFNIFGPLVVNYQLSYSISDPFKASPILTSLGEEYAT